jgi:hypothetical protein
MWVRIIFWMTLLVWIADILQPGYLKFYDLHRAAGLFHQVKIPVNSLTLPAANSTSIPTSTPTACPKAGNDFEAVLNAKNVGCWQDKLSNQTNTFRKKDTREGG